MKYYTVLLVILLSTTPVSLRVPSSLCPDTSLLEGGSAAVTPYATAPEPILTVVSLNMAKENRKDRVLRDLRQSSVFATADLWMLQESTAVVQDIAAGMGMHYVYAPAEKLDHEETSGLAILSRYPLTGTKRVPLPRYDLVFHSRCRIALSATVHAPGGPVHVINAHLDTRITRDQRLRQAAPLLDMENSGVPIIVAGDFNTANIRWIGNLLPVPGQKHTEAIRDLFIESGFDSPLDSSAKTFKLFSLPLHLDWVFAKRLKSVSSGTESIDFSDHNAVWVDLRID
jgi:endonuclease/exonuclease/phosphatase family metal-dependent hydrolase